MSAAAECVHRWRLEEPNGPTVKGRCKRCRRVRTFVTAELDGRDVLRKRKGAAAAGRAASEATRKRKAAARAGRAEEAKDQRAARAAARREAAARGA